MRLNKYQRQQLTVLLNNSYEILLLTTTIFEGICTENHVSTSEDNVSSRVSHLGPGHCSYGEPLNDYYVQ